MNAYENIVLGLLLSCHNALCCVVAVSNGSGSHFSSTDKDKKLANALLDYVSIEFRPFMKAETVLLVKLVRVQEGVQEPISGEEHEVNDMVKILP